MTAYDFKNLPLEVNAAESKYNELNSSFNTLDNTVQDFIDQTQIQIERLNKKIDFLFFTCAVLAVGVITQVVLVLWK